MAKHLHFYASTLAHTSRRNPRRNRFLLFLLVLSQITSPISATRNGDFLDREHYRLIHSQEARASEEDMKAQGDVIREFPVGDGQKVLLAYSAQGVSGYVIDQRGMRPGIHLVKSHDMPKGLRQITSAEHFEALTHNAYAWLRFIGDDVSFFLEQRGFGGGRLHYAAKDGDMTCLQVLLRDPSLRAEINARDESGDAPLHHAALAGHLEAVRFLLDKGADINSVNTRGMSALNLALKNNHTEIIQLLTDWENKPSRTLSSSSSSSSSRTFTGTLPALHLSLLHSLDAREDVWSPVTSDVRHALQDASPLIRETCLRAFPNLVDPTLSLWPPDLLSDDEDVHEHPSLTPDNAGFERIQEALRSLEILAANPEVPASLVGKLNALRETYHTYVTDLCQSTPRERRLLLSPVCMKTEFGGVPYLILRKTAVDLLSIDRHGIATKKNTEGSSVVTHAGALYAKQNLVTQNGDTLNPPLEWAMSTFHRLLFGEGLVPSAVISLAAVPLEGAPSPAKEQEKQRLIAEAREGNIAATDRRAIQRRLREDTSFKNVRDYLLQVTPEVVGEFFGDFLRKALSDPTLFNTLDPYTTQGLILSSLLTNPADAKGDNLMVTWPDAQGVRKIISIDNDLSLSASVIEERPGFHSLEARNILFAIPHFMERSLEQSVRERFLSHTPSLFLLRWLSALESHQRHYQTLLERPNEQTARLLSLHLAEGTLRQMLGKFESLARHVRSNAAVTLQQLMEGLSPLAALTYQTLREAHGPLPAFDLIYRQERFLEDVLNARENKEVQALLSAEHPPKDAYKKRAQTLNEAARELCESIDLSELIPDIRLRVFEEALLSFPEAHAVTTHPSWHDPSLLSIGAFSPITPSTFDFLMRRFPEQINMSDKKYGTPLHCAVEQRESTLAVRFAALLLGKGANPEIKNADGLTPLDLTMGLAMEKRDMSFCDMLITQGAGTHANPDIALKFYRWTRGQKFWPDGQPLLSQLEARNQEIAWHITLAHLLPASGEEPISGAGSASEGQGLQTQDVSQACDLPEVRKAYMASHGQDLLLKGATLGERVLSASLVPQLLSPDGRVIRRTLEGNHVVGFVEQAGRRLYFKFYPELPGYEEAVGLLTREMIGFGSPYTELARLGDVPILISQGIGGQNLRDVLNHHPQTLQALDDKSLSAMMVAAMVINPEDGKPDNYIVEPLPFSLQKYRLIGIDNDHAFVPAIAKEKKGLFSLEPAVQVKTILYALDAMQTELHPAVRQQFLTFHVGDLLEGWMRELRRRNTSYRALFNTSEVLSLLDQHNSYIGIPFEKGAIEHLYEKLVRLQRFIFDKPAISHLKLLSCLEPGLGNRYQKGFETPSTPLRRFALLDAPFYKKSKDGRHITMTKSGNILNSKNIPLKASLLQMMKESAAHGEEDFRPKMALDVLREIRKQHAETTLLEHILPPGASPQLNRAILQKIRLGSKLTEILKDIDFRNIGEPDQRAVFDLLKDKELDALTLKNARALTDAVLGTLNLKKIEILNLTGCLALTDTCFPLFTQMPNLASLNVSDISGIFDMAKKGFLGSFTLEALNFENLRSLNVSRCPHLRAIYLTAPLLEQVNADACPTLMQMAVRSPPFKLTLRDSPHLTDELLDRLIGGCSGIETLDLKGCSQIIEIELRERYPYPYLGRFLKGKLIYRPTEGSDTGRVDLKISALANPLEGEFDLSACGNTGKYLSINTGYRKGKRSENASKVEIWFTPRFLIEKVLESTAKHFAPIFPKQWPESAPVGIIWTWGGDAGLGDYDYLTNQKMDEIGSGNLYKKWCDGACVGVVRLLEGGGVGREAWMLVHVSFVS